MLGEPKKLIIVFFVVLITISACGTPTTTTTSPLTSPLSPVATAVPEVQPTTLALVPFRLDEPLLEGATEVSGQGPAGVPITIMDISFMKPIGNGTIDSENRFTIKVEPLMAPNMVGIMLDESKESPYPKDQLPCEDRCRDQPLVGLLFDRVPVRRSE